MYIEDFHHGKITFCLPPEPNYLNKSWVTYHGSAAGSVTTSEMPPIPRKRSCMTITIAGHEETNYTLSAALSTFEKIVTTLDKEDQRRVVFTES